jgi:protein-tyrosine phosphatase
MITRVWERLCLSGLDDAEKLVKANSHGINRVVTLCSETVQKRASRIAYVHIPVADSRPISAAKFDSVINAIAENIRWGTVLLNCGAGMSRAPIMLAAWMHVVGYKNISAALQEIAKLRPLIDPSPVLLASVKECL